MINKVTFAFLVLVFITLSVPGQNDPSYKLRITIPVIDAPENFEIPYHVPTMQQALEFSNDFYELGFWGIDELGNKVFKNPSGDKFSNNAFKYLLGLAFAKYGSELPIPLGVWGHEEYHRAVLGNTGVSSKNGNWLFTRWDGTVFGVSDQELSELKENDLNTLLYAYTSGVQYEVDLNRKITINDFFNKRTHFKNALLLYNSWYVYDYFRFSTSDKSDSVKVIAPDNESIDPIERDFAGADLTAWVYDMFNPELPFTSRDAFPDGEGVNRRIGFSDLSEDARDYLKKQKNLALLNFINPAIFFINRITINDNFSFNIFTQYAPTHFGNDMALYLPFTLGDKKLLIDFHRYSNYENAGPGLGLGIFDLELSNRIKSDIRINIWNQPNSFFSDEKTTGGFINFESRYEMSDNLSFFLGIDGKTEGWMIGEPILDNSYSVVAGINFNLKDQ